MADASEIEPATEQQQQQQQQQPGGQKQGKKKAPKREKPDDAVKLGCGGLFRRKKKSAKSKGEKETNGDGEDGASRAPIEKPKKPAGKSSVKGTVKIEDGPQAQMWANIVSNSMVGTGVFSRAAVCSLATGGVLARSPEDFTPSVEQVAALRDNFDSSRRAVFSGAGFGVADTVYGLQEETGTPEVLCGADAEQTEGVLVALSSTAVLIGAYREKLDRAMEMLVELRSHFIDQGL